MLNSYVEYILYRLSYGVTFKKEDIMQIKIGFSSNEDIQLPVHYNHILQAFIYNNIDSQSGRTMYLQFLRNIPSMSNHCMDG